MFHPLHGFLLSLVISITRSTSQQTSQQRGELHVVLVIALEIRDLVSSAWKAYRATQTRRQTVSGSHTALRSTLAPTT